MDRPRAPVVPLLIVAVFFLLLLFYAVGYFALGNAIPIYQEGAGFTTRPTTRAPVVRQMRFYRTGWQAKVYWPMARIESLIRGIEVEVHHSDVLSS